MDPRSVAHALAQIADFLELKGENRFKSAAYRNAAGAILAVQTDDLSPALASGELAELKGIGPTTLSTIRDLVDGGEGSRNDSSPIRSTSAEARSVARSNPVWQAFFEST
jgi:DNA polymerase/3'-5' exonuclease PolX